MGKIIVLDEATANKIAAGEVIERPASIVKELIENSIDAGASNITIEIKNGGISYIKVTDNGTGMEEDDVKLAFERHATSKIRKAEDLEGIGTLGFRGEALSSISAVSSVEIVTRTEKSSHGARLTVQGGAVTGETRVGAPVGTAITVSNLFFNTPARYKFLKKDSTEAGYISDVVNRLAMGNPHISFRLINRNIEALRTPGNGDLKSCIHSIYGKTVSDSLIEINYEKEGISVRGYVGDIGTARSNRNFEIVFVNSRYVRSKTIVSAIEDAFNTLLPANRFPFAVLNIVTNPVFVDVNVHPSKMEVKFSDEQMVYSAVYHAVSNGFAGKKTLPETTDNRHAWGIRDSSCRYEQVPMRKTGWIKENLEPELLRSIIGEEKDSGYATGQPQKKEISENIIPQKENNNITESVSADLDYKIIGQAFSTYIFIEAGDEIYIIDQHAAHERVMYEKLLNRLKDSESASQVVACPEVIEYTGAELEFINEHRQDFEDLGFRFEVFGRNSVAVRAVPFVLSEGDVAGTFREITDLYMEGNRKNDTKGLKESAIYRIACKSAVKANKNLSRPEIEQLLKDLMKTGKMFTCPHGRPTVTKITKHELEKRFLRV